MKLYNRQYAFIIGISQYQKREYNLRTAESDARELKSLLENDFNFNQIDVLYNEQATGSAIMDQLDWYAQNLDKDDGLFIYYGGHGRIDKEVGYLIPYDGDSNIFNRNNLFMTTLVPYFKNIIPARQIFFTIASCFSGEFLYTRSTEPETVLRDVVRQRREKPQKYESRLSRITKEYTRQVLTAGSHDEQMIDNWKESQLSPFAQLMIDGLLESENYIEAEELAGYIRREMNRLVDKKIIPFHQTPLFSDMIYKGKGCFVFQRKHTYTAIGADPIKIQPKPGKIVSQVRSRYTIDDLKTSGMLEEYIDEGGKTLGKEWFKFYKELEDEFELESIQQLKALIEPIISQREHEAEQRRKAEAARKAAEEQAREKAKAARKAAEVQARKKAELERKIKEATQDMVLVEGGWFDMGSNDGRDDVKPVHKVYVDSFYMDKYQVTNQQYAEFLNAYGSDTVKSGENAGQKMINEDKWGVKKTGGKWQPVSGYENHPVVGVTWYGANEYAKYYGKRLPTEAEWEYAGRGGQQSKGYKYSGSDDPDDVAWNDDNSYRKTHPVGGKQANELGLYDMSGNVWEWCADWYADDYYKTNPEKNPKGPVRGTSKALRGGSWFDFNGKCRLAYRDFNHPDNYYGDIGFRCAHDVVTL